MYGLRIDRELLAEVAWPPSERRHIYVCGPTGWIRTERFGATGS